MNYLNYDFDIDTNLYLHPLELFKDVPSGKEYISIINNYESLDSSEFKSQLPLIEYLYDKAVKECHLPVLDNPEIDITKPFFGYGWGASENDIHGLYWRRINLTKKAILFVHLPAVDDYLIRCLVKDAKDDSSEWLRIFVNGQLADMQYLVTESDAQCYYYGILPKEMIKPYDKFAKIEFCFDLPYPEIIDRVDPLYSYSLTKVFCRPFAGFFGKSFLEFKNEFAGLYQNINSRLSKDSHKGVQL